jgi:hypothetical protein
MSNTLHKINIDLMKITGASKIKAKDGKEYLAIDLTQNAVFVGQKGGVYLSLDMRENRDGEDQYGNSHMITISPTKEQRAAKERTPIVGNAKTLTFGSSSAPSAAPRQAPQAQDDDDNDFVPF